MDAFDLRAVPNCSAAGGLLGASSCSDHDPSQRPMDRPPEAADRAVADPAAVLDGRLDALREWNPMRTRESPFSSGDPQGARGRPD